ncbi:DUF480 domain-containing protein [Thiocapsa imhoffii]|uniref:DUF480 domain-containing protein n=1 Tax=Thiocapsa imhoffii TaxID=382777 RepID=A0A9X0WH67_9GAMM|nr:YceH family protein [Thiocapsa imhoffii]MBK1644047.1 DUF480 domain-containing protein [Thiocapsa imhoffii]
MSSDDASETVSTDAMLSAKEARVIGALMEKQRTTPDQYPLTLNGLVSACNQKSARHPVMNMTPGEVGHLVNQLRDRGLIHASFTGRTERYDHKMVGTFMLSREEQALLCVLMLRGPQTVGELRTNTARLAEFRDLEQVTTTLQSMMHGDRPLVTELPLRPGNREERFAHLLCGQPRPEAIAPARDEESASRPAESKFQRHEARLAALESAVAELRAQIEQLQSVTGPAERR